MRSYYHTWKEQILKFVLPSLLLVFGLFVAIGTSAQEATQNADELDEVDIESSEETDEENADGEDVEDEDMEEVVATGTRLLHGDSTSNMVVYNAEDIAATGATTIDDFFRKIPQQFSSTNPQTSYIGNTGDDLIGDTGGISGAFDLATANLHGLGSANTLVLLDGQRLAGYGGSESDIVNILGIPIAAIERIEIQLDGGSAVYGADAIAGVVNFISKKNYQGITSSYTQENSATGSDKYAGSIVFGINIGRLRSTTTLTFDQQEPIINTKAGHGSLNFDHIGPEFDYRFVNIGQPGVVRHWNCSVFSPGPYYNDWNCGGTFLSDPNKINSYQLPKGHNGLGATVEDFKSGPYWDYSHIDFFDRVPYENGAHLDNDGLLINAAYEFSDSAQLNLQILRNRRSSFQKAPIPAISVVVPASNAYNPFGEPMHVFYAPALEQDSGLLPTPYTNILTDRDRINLQFQWNFHPNHQLLLTVNEDRTHSDDVNYSVPTRRDRNSPGAEEYFRRLASSDPDVAFNFFGNGTHQSAGIDSSFVSETSRTKGTNAVTSTEIFLKGFLWEMMGERVSYVIGKTTRTTRYSQRRIAVTGGIELTFDPNLVWNGTSEPVYRNESYPMELWIPIFGGEYGGWWGQELHLTLQSQRSIDSSWGAIGGGNSFELNSGSISVWNPETTEWEEVENVFWFGFGAAEDIPLVLYRKGDTIPTVGFSYVYNESLRFRANRAIAVQQPDISELFDTDDGFGWVAFDVLDLYDPDGPTLHPQMPYHYGYGNPDLDSEISTNTSYRVTWEPTFSFLRGLSVEANYTKINVSGSIRHSSAYFGIPEALASDGIAIRNDRGDLISLRYNNFNSLRRLQKNSEVTIQYEFSRDWLGFLRTSATYSRVHDNFEEPYAGFTIDDLGTSIGQDKYKGRFNAYWNRRQMSATLIVHYTPPHVNERAHYCTLGQKFFGIGRCAEFGLWDANSWIALDVGSHISVDATFSYDFDEHLQIKVGSQNLLNRDAPHNVRSNFGFYPLPYDPVRWNARGRIVSLTMRYITGGL
ncbi:MAG: TonB-dependent receptor [Gammaproteobacteria bacterium]|nr:TonB-dependent receptor [Gammaproteobacteria bacterium]